MLIGNAMIAHQKENSAKATSTDVEKTLLLRQSTRRHRRPYHDKSTLHFCLIKEITLHVYIENGHRSWMLINTDVLMYGDVRKCRRFTLLDASY